MGAVVACDLPMILHKQHGNLVMICFGGHLHVVILWWQQLGRSVREKHILSKLTSNVLTLEIQQCVLPHPPSFNFSYVPNKKSSHVPTFCSAKKLGFNQKMCLLLPPKYIIHMTSYWHKLPVSSFLVFDDCWPVERLILNFLSNWMYIWCINLTNVLVGLTRHTNGIEWMQYSHYYFTSHMNDIEWWMQYSQYSYSWTHQTHEGWMDAIYSLLF